MAIPYNVIAFAGNENKTYEKFRDYYFQFSDEVMGKKIGGYDASVSLAEKEAKMNEALLSEVERISGMKRPEGVTIEAWSANPSVKWAVPTVANIMIDAIIPETIIRSFGLYTDIKYVGYGEVAQFDVEPNALFTVSEGNYRPAC